MTRFFRTAYSLSLVCLVLAMIAAISTGVEMPFPAFACLMGGLLVFLLPDTLQKLEDRRTLFTVLAAAAALLGFVPILLNRCPTFHYVVHALSILAAALLLRSLRHNTTYHNFRARFTFINVILAVVIAYVMLFASTTHQISGSIKSTFFLNAEYVKISINSVLAHLIVLLACGILCLRGLRAEKGVVNEQAFRRRQLRDALLFVTAVSVVLSVLPLLKPLWDILLYDVLAPLAQRLARLLERLFAALATPSGHYTGTPEASSPAETLSQANPLETVSATGQSLGEYVSTHRPPPAGLKSDAPAWVILMLLILTVVIAVATLIFIKALRRSKQYDRGYPNETREELPQEEDRKKEEKPLRRSTDPRKRIRYLYAEFLRRLNRVTPQQSGTAGAPESGSPAADWGNNDSSSYARMRTEMSAMSSSTSSSSSFAYINARDEALRNEQASVLMRVFDRKSRGNRRRAGKAASDAAGAYKTSTCQEIRTSAEARTRAEKEDLAAFTALYEQARYQLEQSPSRQDAARMEKLLSRIRQGL